MSLFMTLRIAFKALGRNKLRTVLTMLGMIIGVAAVIAMVALGSGAQAQIEEAVKAQGTNLITISPGSMAMVGGVRGGAGTSTRLTEADAAALRDMPQAAYVAETATASGQQLIYASMNWRTNIEGTNVDLPAFRQWPMMYGTFFTPEDVKSQAKVIVLGANVSDQLFGEGMDPTDTIIRVRNHQFKVLGVMSRKGASTGGMGNQDGCGVPWAPGQCLSMTACAMSATPAARSVESLTIRDVLELPSPALLHSGPTFAPELPPPRA